MDLGQAISYNGITLSNNPTFDPSTPLRGVVVTACDFGDVDSVGYLEKRALQDGMDANDVFLGARTVIIDAAIYGSSIGDMWDILNGFVQSFSPVIAYNFNSGGKGFQPLQFVRPTSDTATWPTATYPNGIPLEIDCRPLGPPKYRVVRDEQGGLATKGSSIRARAVLVAADPRIYLQSSTSIVITTSSQTAANRGSYPTLPILTFAMTAAGHASATFSIDGLSIRLNLSTVTTGSFTVRYTSRVILDQNSTFRNDLFDTSYTQRFAAIDAFDSVVIGTNLNGISAPTLTYTEAFP
jgi:hypothetical protein